jgi:hypothetical protein
MNSKKIVFDSELLQTFKKKLKGALFCEVEEDENSDEYRHVQFVGQYEGAEVVYDAIIYTLRLQHELELYEMAEHEAAKHFPDYKKLNYEEDENGNLKALDSEEEAIGLYMAEVIIDLQEEEVVKVKEHIDYDLSEENAIGLDVGLHRESISTKTIEEFIAQFNNGKVTLDDTWYSFHQEEESA